MKQVTIPGEGRMKRLDELGRQTKDLAKMAIDMDMDALDVVDWNADIQEILKAYKEQQMDNGLFETSKLYYYHGHPEDLEEEV